VSATLRADGCVGVAARVLVRGSDVGGAGKQVGQVLRVAGGHGDDRGIDRHELARRPLSARAAGRADIEDHLVAAAPVVTRPAEDVTGHRQQHGIIV
jgi:hypothetical protein